MSSQIDGEVHPSDSDRDSAATQGDNDLSDSDSESIDMTKEGKLSPYFLSTSDKAGDRLIVVTLKNDNYDEWALKLRGALRSKKKTGFIDGSIKKPADDSKDLEDWYMVNAMVVNWIFNCIDPDLGSSISYMEEAKVLWDDIEQRFSVGNGPKLHRTKGSIMACKQGENETVTEYFGRLKKLWDELDKLDRQPNCTCDGCKCGLNKQLDKKRDEDKLHAFLLGIDSAYSIVVSNLLLQEPLPSLNRAYSTLIQEEGVKGKIVPLTGARSTENRGAPIGGFAARYIPSARTPEAEEKEYNEGRPKCDHCNKWGHLKKSCFELIGYPKNWRERGRGNGGAFGRGRGGSSSTGTGRGSAASARVNDDRVDNKEQYVSVPKEQWDAYVNHTKASSSKVRMNGKTDQTDLWLLDSGATHHMTGNFSCLRDVQDTDACMVALPNGKFSKSTKEGTVSIGGNLLLKHVLFVPDFNCNLVSIFQLSKDIDCEVKFTNNTCVIQDRISKKTIGKCEQQGRLYLLEGASKVEVHAAEVHATIKDDVEFWHCRLGHPSRRVVNLLPFIDNNKSSKHDTSLCDVCLRAKQTRDKFIISENKAKSIFELIHCDLWGDYRVTSSCGSRYFLTILDDFSRSVWVYLVKAKSEVTQLLQNFVVMAKRQFDAAVKIIRTDNGTEFTCLKNYFDTQGILHQTTCVGTSQQNGRVERKHRHILNVARALRFQAGLPVEFWGECVLTAGYLINRTPSVLLQGKTPYEVLFAKRPSYANLRTFGCLCYVKHPRKDGDKFASRSRRCIFVGYPFGKKGWEVYDLETKEYFISRDVVFDEFNFPFLSKIASPAVEHGAHDKVSLEVEGEFILTNIPVNDETFYDDDGESDEGERVDGAATGQREAVDPTGELEFGRGKRPHIPWSKYSKDDYVTGTARVLTDLEDYSPSTSSHSPSTSSGMPFPLAHVVCCDKFSLRHRAFVAAVDNCHEPTSFREAVKDSRWRDAMNAELDALDRNGTWEIVDLPVGKKAIGNKWVYKIKLNADGSVERFKARLVILGNRQEAGIDFFETFAPTAKMVTVRVFLAVAAARNWELHQMDVHNAFLHGNLDEEVYMRLPHGYSVAQPGKVCRLKKSLYGLRQASRCWFAKLSDSLLAFGFRQCMSDYSLFCYQHGDVEVFILVYVDDLVIGGNDADGIRRVKDYLRTYFHMKDLGSLKYFLGLEVARSSSGIFLCQRKYALDILTETGLLGARPSSIPLEQNHKLGLADDAFLKDPEVYRRLVGRLIYLTNTRPDLSYSVHILSCFMHAPRETHWQAALRVVRYIKNHPGQGLLFPRHSSLAMTVYCDADWSSCPVTRRSLTAYFVLLGGTPISWKTKKQPTVSLSSAESEYRAMRAATCEVKWLQGILQFLRLSTSSPALMHCDNKAALHISRNPVFHERTKHIEIDCHFVRDAIRDGLIQPAYVHTSAQLADILTKALGERQFASLLSKLGVVDPHAPT
ncbi:hypothetical protein vseg_002041 [Gypsophila vaccaria]